MSPVGQLSDDGLWWWDGRTWIPTSRVVLPDLPTTEFEQSGKLAVARANLAKARPSLWVSILLAPVLPDGLITAIRRSLSDYRTWTIEQLSLATTYLLGPDEPMLAGEMSRYAVGAYWTRNLGVAVTAAHVIVFRIDHLEGQPRWVAMAALARDVRMTRRSLMFGWVYQALEVTGPNGRWSILGFVGEEFDPQSVLEAWQKAVAASRAS